MHGRAVCVNNFTYISYRIIGVHAWGGGNECGRGNCERDFHRLVRRSSPSLMPYMVTIPVASPGPDAKQVEWPVLPPHEAFAHFMANGAHERIVGTWQPQHFAAFWDRARTCEPLSGHPAFEMQDLSHTVPLRCHGDEGPALRKLPLLVLSWSSVASHGSSWSSRQLFAVVPKVRYYVRSGLNLTVEALLTFLVWSFHQLLRGVWPAEDHEGRAWPPGPDTNHGA